jgi:hypothetical protein
VATPLYVHAGVRVQISYFPLFHFKGKTLATKLFAQKKKIKPKFIFWGIFNHYLTIQHFNL